MQRAAGAKVAARRRTAEASGHESVRRAGKFHARFAKSSAQVFGSEASELSFARKRCSRSKALDAVVHPLHEPSLVRLREGRSTREVSKLIFELKEIQRGNYRLNTRVRVRGSESGSKGEPCTVRCDYG